MKIGITLTSSLEVGDKYIKLTEQVAKSLATHNIGIVYGGTAYGMMSTLATSYKEAGGTDLTGVMANDLMTVTKNYIAYNNLDTSFIEETMEERKHKIIELSDAFIILPGGYGTLEEIGSIVGGKVNKLYDKPIAILNYDGFYNTLINFLNEMQYKAFTKIPLTDIVFVSNDLDEILNHFDNYQKNEIADKFLK